MTLTTFEFNDLTTFGAGADSFPIGTILTVPANNNFFIKEILLSWDSSAAVQIGIYILPSGGTALTTAGAASSIMARARAETETVFVMLPIQTSAAGGTAVFARNTLLEAGDTLQGWISYGAVTPTVQTAVKVSGDQFST